MHALNVISPFARTLDQELVALLRGASLECLVCGEFVMHSDDGGVFCPECCSQLATEEVLQQDCFNPRLQSPAQAG